MRFISLRLFLFFLYVWVLSTVAFGWIVKTSMESPRGVGSIGRIALSIASFPSTSREVIDEVLGYATGDYADAAFSVKQEIVLDYSGFEEFETLLDKKISGLLMHASKDEMITGWRVLLGAFKIDGAMENAALLISPDLKISRIWILDEIPLGGIEPRAKHLKFVHGMAVLPDGSLIFTFDGSVSAQKFDACGNRLWATKGEFNHSVSLTESNQSFWAIRGDNVLSEVSTESGQVSREIKIEEIIAANPTIDILELRRFHSNDLTSNSRNTNGTWSYDRFHLNDVDPLPAVLASDFDEFEAGDLLISARSLNLIFVLDPETLEIKWWRIGEVQRQHDPDWLRTGEILVLNNRMSRDFSEIVTIDPKNFEKTVILDGRDYDFYTRIRGKVQMLSDGTLVISSPQQGRAFEVEPSGKISFEVANLKPDEPDVNYVVSELMWLPEDYFDADAWNCPAANP